MKWSKTPHGRWMEACHLCKGYVGEEILSSLERRYACTNPGCAAHFQLFVSHPRDKKRGAFACLITALAAALREAMETFLYEELYASCPVCDAALKDRGDGVLFCPSGDCGVSVEFYLEKLHLSFVHLLVIMRVSERGFLKVFERTLKPHHYN